MAWSPALRQRVEQVVRIIRSKGVGAYFCSQFPDDVPDEILGQLGRQILRGVLGGILGGSRGR